MNYAFDYILPHPHEAQAMTTYWSWCLLAILSYTYGVEGAVAAASAGESTVAFSFVSSYSKNSQ